MDTTDPLADLDDVAVRREYGRMLATLEGVSCTRCKGTGREPQRPIRKAWLAPLQRAYEAGLARASYNTARSVRGLEALHQAYAEIREVLTEARTLDIPQPLIATVVGVSRAQLDNIRTGRAGPRAEVDGIPAERFDAAREHDEVGAPAG